MKLDYKLITDVQLDGLDFKDAPDFSDTYIASAYYDGKPMTEEQLDVLNQDGSFIYEEIINKIY